MHRRLASMLLVGCLAASMVANVPAASAAPPVGVADVEWRRIEPRKRPALASTGRAVAVFGGAAADDWYSRYPYRDGGLLHPGTGRWDRIPPAPFDPPLSSSSWVWTGDEFVVAGSQCVEESFAEGVHDGCARARLKLATYTPSDRRWRKIGVPRSAATAVLDQPLLWTGREAWFGALGRVFAVDPARGTVRALPLFPDDPMGLSSQSEPCVAGTRVAIVESDVAGAPVPRRVLVLDRRERWAEIPVPEIGFRLGDGFLFACTERALALVTTRWTATSRSSGYVEVGDVWRYDLRSSRWRTTSPVMLRAEGVLIARGHGRVVDLWPANSSHDPAEHPVSSPGARYDVASDTWTPIVPGPRASEDTGSVAWVGDIAVTTDLGAPGGTQPLVTYRPR